MRVVGSGSDRLLKRSLRVLAVTEPCAMMLAPRNIFPNDMPGRTIIAALIHAEGNDEDLGLRRN